jgi:hypothetical protein
MDYSESIISLQHYLRDVLHAANARKFKEARDISAEILAEAQQLVNTFDNKIEVNGEQV